MSAPRWWVYVGNGTKHSWELPPAPHWRQFDGAVSEARPAGSLGWLEADVEHDSDRRQERLAAAYRAEHDEALLINAAIRLRRPLLVTGGPGVGKSTLAYSIAHELDLGKVLRWPITSRTTLQDGLYHYDAIGRLQASTREHGDRDEKVIAPEIGRYLSLGPLGTALLPLNKPRVLLVDEFDKGDVDLANDLLTVLEEGRFNIRELQRVPERAVTVLSDDAHPVQIDRGRVLCAEFPIIVITSNGERQFSPAFLRRCVRLHIGAPSRKKLERIVAAHLGEHFTQKPTVQAIIGEFADFVAKPGTLRATDQLLNLLSLHGQLGDEATAGVADWDVLSRRLMSPLDGDIFIDR